MIPPGSHSHAHHTRGLCDTHLHLQAEARKKVKEVEENLRGSAWLTASTFTTCAVLGKVIAAPTGDSVPAAGVGSHRVNTRLAKRARIDEGHTLVPI